MGNINKILIYTLIFVFLTIFVESVSLILQLKGEKLTRWFGKNAFKIHMIITVTLWITTFILVFVLQFDEHPKFHESQILKYIGLFLFCAGFIISIWASALLGLKRLLCMNFFEEDVPVINKSLYKYINNPVDYGLWTALIGFAIFTRSFYNLIIAIEFIIIMIPHVKLENIPIKKRIKN